MKKSNAKKKPAKSAKKKAAPVTKRKPIGTKKSASPKKAASTKKGVAQAAYRAKVAADQKAGAYGNKVAAQRIARGWSQKELAARLGVTQPCICGIERGRARPRLALAAKLMKDLGVPAAPAHKREVGARKSSPKRAARTETPCVELAAAAEVVEELNAPAPDAVLEIAT